jgi:hypothetical protein
MNELKEIRVNDQRLLLNDNLVKSAILPRASSELERDVVIQGDTTIEGAVYARYLEIQKGKLEVQGAIFTQIELHINTDAKGSATFCKAVGSADSIVSLAPGYRAIFQADVNAKQVKLRNAFVAGSIFADEIALEDCIVIGGVFASSNLEISNSIIGTFNSPRAQLSKVIHLLLPSAFTVEKINAIPGTEMFNLSLADLGSLFKGKEQSKNSGKIKMSLEADELKSVLRSEATQQVIRSYTVIGKVLAADLLDIDKFNNHFLLTAASLGSQLLRTYDLGMENGSAGKTLTIKNISNFFFDILLGKIDIQEMSGEFSMKDIVDKFK